MKKFNSAATGILFSALGFIPAQASTPVVFTVDTSRTHQEIDCFGASDAWSMRFIGEMPQQTQEDVARLLFSREVDSNGNPEGIGLSIWRFNIGAGSVEQNDSSHINPHR